MVMASVMIVSKTDFEEMTINFSRTIRTTDSERYILFSNDPEAGEKLSYSSRNASRIGVLIIQYASNALSRPYVGGTVILQTDWEEEAVTGLVSLIDNRIVGRGLYGIHKQIRQTQQMVESIPETIDEVIAEQYDEIEDIIEAQDLDKEEKRRRVRDKLRVGLEMGLPTIMYEGSAEER